MNLLLMRQCLGRTCAALEQLCMECRARGRVAQHMTTQLFGLSLPKLLNASEQCESLPGS